MNRAVYTAVSAPAQLAAAVIGFSADAWLAIAAQFVQEKGDAYWTAYPHVSEFNFSNTGIVGGEALNSEGAGITAYAYTLLISNPAAYKDYVDAGRRGDLQAAVAALAISPWANPPYGHVIMDVLDSVLGGVPSSAGSTPAPSEPPSTSSERWVTVTASPPDNTMWGMGQSRGIAVQTIMRLNPGVDPRDLQVGQRIRIA